MARKSDLSQKLLDDIRLRKERMGITQSTKQVTQAPADKFYGKYSQQSLQGLGEAMNSQFNSNSMFNKDGTKMWFGTRQYKTPAYNGTSLDIVQFGAGRVEQNIDVSMALALALSNTGKLQNVELIMQYGSLNLQEMNSRSMSGRRFPTDGFPSNLQLGEVSRGVQKLNKILNTYSSGLQSGSGSLDIGRELLKGAMDLEESLRMLVSLQEASDYMVGSNGRQVRLLKGKEKDDSSSDKKRQGNRPWFSFDGSSRRLHELGGEDKETSIPEKKPLALLYSENEKFAKSNSDKSAPNVFMQFITHRRSLSYTSGTKADSQFSDTSKNSYSEETTTSLSGTSSSKSNKWGSRGGPTSEKIRISNVVAKLMGLEEFPPPKKEVDAQPKGIKIQGKDNQVQNIYKRVSEKEKAAKLDTIVNQQEVYKTTISEKPGLKTHSENKALYERETMEIRAGKISPAASSKGKTSMKDLNSMENKAPASNYFLKSYSDSKKMEIESMCHKKETRAAKKKDKMMEEHREINNQKSTVKIEHLVPDVDHDQRSAPIAPYVHRKGAAAKHESNSPKKRVLLAPRNAQQALESLNGQKHNTSNNVPRQRTGDNKTKQTYAVHGSEKERQHNPCNKQEHATAKQGDGKLKNIEKYPDEIRAKKLSSRLTVEASNRSSTKATNTGKQIEQLTNIQHKGTRKGKRLSTNKEQDTKTETETLKDRSHFTKDTRTEEEKIKHPSQTAGMPKSVHLRSTEKEDVIQIAEEIPRTETLHAKEQQIKHQSSVLQELEQRYKEKYKKDKDEKFKDQTRNAEHQFNQRTACTSLSHNMQTDDLRKLRRMANQVATAETNRHGETITTSPLPFTGTSHIEHIEASPLNLQAEESQGLIDSLHQSNFENLTGQKKEPSPKIGEKLLTEQGDCFKQMLVNSQHFLNAAQALFKLEIPVGILQASENVCQGEENTLKQDCVYELMRRKNRREEIILTKRLSFVPARERCLDDLIQELTNDIESLQFPTGKGDDNEAAEFVHKILETDIQNNNPDLNCMWDIGWARKLFADAEKDEVIRDVERHVLIGLINELVQDLLN